MKNSANYNLEEFFFWTHQEPLNSKAPKGPSREFNGYPMCVGDEAQQLQTSTNQSTKRCEVFLDISIG